MTQFAQRVFTKRVLYLICFMALNLIEFLRATQAGNIWNAAANCTGPVMMVLIFSALPLRELADRFNRIYILLCAAAMVAVHFYWTAHQGEILWGEAQTAVLNVCWIGIAVRYFFRRVIVEKGSADRIPFRPGIAGWLWIALKKCKVNDLIALPVVGVAGALTNTVLVMGSIFLLLAPEFAAAQNIGMEAVLGVVLGIVFSSGAAEAVAAGILVTAVCKAMLHVPALNPRPQANT